MNGESKLHPILTSHLMVRMMVATGEDRGLPLASLSRMRGIIIISARIETHPRST